MSWQKRVFREGKTWADEQRWEVAKYNYYLASVLHLTMYYADDVLL